MVARGPGGTLVYYWATPGSAWRSVQVAGPGTTASAPSVAVDADGRAAIVAQGPEASLLYYSGRPGGPWPGSDWHGVQVAGPRTTYSAPSVFVRPDGRIDVVARGTDFSLVHYRAQRPGSPWQTMQVAGPGTTGYIPSVFVRPDGQVDIAAQGPDASLLYYRAAPGADWPDADWPDADWHSADWHSVQVAGPRTTFSAPSVFVRPDGRVDIAAVGPGDTLLYHWAAPGSQWPGSEWHSTQVAPADEAMSSAAPSIFVRPDGEADITAVGPRGTVMYYRAAPGAVRAGSDWPGSDWPGSDWPGSDWQSVQVDVAARPFQGVSVFVRPDGQADIVARGSGNLLMYYWATPGSPWRGTRLSPAG